MFPTFSFRSGGGFETQPESTTGRQRRHALVVRQLTHAAAELAHALVQLALPLVEGEVHGATLTSRFGSGNASGTRSKLSASHSASNGCGFPA